MSDPSNKPSPSHRSTSCKKMVLGGVAAALGVVLVTVGVIVGLLIYTLGPVFTRDPINAFMWLSLPFLLVGSLILIGLVLQPLHRRR